MYICIYVKYYVDISDISENEHHILQVKSTKNPSQQVGLFWCWEALLQWSQGVHESSGPSEAVDFEHTPGQGGREWEEGEVQVKLLIGEDEESLLVFLAGT